MFAAMIHINYQEIFKNILGKYDKVNCIFVCMEKYIYSVVNYTLVN